MKLHLRFSWVVFCFSLVILLFTPFGHKALAFDDPKSDAPTGIEWHKGPYQAHLGQVAEIKIPEGYAFTDSAGTRRFMELTHNPSSSGELGLIIPISKEDDSKGSWFLIFDFDEVGYISDSEKSSLDADKILASLKANTERGNEFRREKGWAAFHLTGWQQPPFYEEKTHNLTWATLGNGEDDKEGKTVNYSTRILGRRGAMSVDLVLDPSQLDQVLPAYQQLLNGFSFSAGSRYSEFVKGDKVASYGLTALIAGGAAAAVVKTGLLSKLLAGIAALWKFILVGLVALGSAIKRFFSNLKQRILGKDANSSIAANQQEISSGTISSDHDDSY
ncbi:DUF2167 domain-containing protein [Edaphobacter bradus]|uniref:DUF2167 domain-containing protein n=1 Tax=Edaphobacter bradus TaxID=2259016 RepID=UPI0021DFD1D4|nr:DUF2167 domain-containing protein [Edaphobacter bradus]